MSDIVIQVDNLSKKYKIGSHHNRGSSSIREMISDSTQYVTDFLFNKNSKYRTAYEEFWALKNISFQINQGDVVGIIGRNGAGKSTLLKILSRIVEPTTGQIRIKGRIASLLEVGTGFHPELTGRENIFLNGAIIGMTRAEIFKKFDEIIAFAEIDKFIDTPVKRYSSGMYVRLAFAIAANLEPEILIIDEVLAVGDASFRKKCLTKMNDVSKEGKTVLLVSHQMTSIQALANKALLLEKGQTQGITNVKKAVDQYLYADQIHYQGYFLNPTHPKNKQAYIVGAKILDKDFNIKVNFYAYEPIYIIIKWTNLAGVAVTPIIRLLNRQGVTVLIATDTPIDFDGTQKKSIGTYLSTIKLPGNFLNSNDYILSIALDCGIPRICYDYHHEILRFSVTDPMNELCIARGLLSSIREDAVLWPALECSWEKVVE